MGGLSLARAIKFRCPWNLLQFDPQGAGACADNLALPIEDVDRRIAVVSAFRLSKKGIRFDDHSTSQRAVSTNPAAVEVPLAFDEAPLQTGDVPQARTLVGAA